MIRTTIQRYMDLPKFISLLQTKSLYLTKMSMFEDALEGGLTVADFFKTSNAPAQIDLAINGFWPVANESETDRAHRLEKARQASKEVYERKFETPFGSFLCDEAERIFPVCREWLYVSCWHQSEHECSAMWRLYGNDKNSLCIFSTLDKLKEGLALDTCTQLAIESVNYIDHTSDSFSNNPLSPFISKSKPYSFEKEVRVVSWNSQVDISQNSKNDRLGVLVKVDLHTLIEKVVISPYADNWFKEAVEKLCYDAHPRLSVDIKDSSIRMQPITDLYQAMAYTKAFQRTSR